MHTVHRLRSTTEIWESVSKTKMLCCLPVSRCSLAPKPNSNRIVSFHHPWSQVTFHDDSLVAHRRHVRSTSSARAHHHRDLTAYSENQ